jgi:rod shape-determining protein MreC
LTRVTAPARTVAQRFGVLLLMAAALALLILGKTHGEAVGRLRALAVDGIAPVMEVLSTPVASARQVITEAEKFLATYHQNSELRQQVARLSQWQAVARRLEQENAGLRAQLDFSTDAAPIFITARVIADAGGLFVNSALINVGREDGVRAGQAVTTGSGLAGRVVEVGRRSARFLLLIDLNARVPVVVEQSRHRAVLAGDNSDRPKLVFLPANAKVNPGDRVVTSGHAGVFPPGLPVGTIASVTDGEARVQPIVDWQRLEYVTVLRYAALPAGGLARPVDGD